MRNPMTTDCDSRLAYLQDEIDRYQRAESEQQERAERARRERRRELEETIRLAERQAEDWPEALRKGAYLFEREAEPMNNEERNTIIIFFEHSARACRRALEIWSAVEQEQEAEIAVLEARLAELRDAIRLETARRLRQSESSSTEIDQIARALETMTPEEFLEW